MIFVSIISSLSWSSSQIIPTESQVQQCTKVRTAELLKSTTSEVFNDNLMFRLYPPHHLRARRKLLLTYLTSLSTPLKRERWDEKISIISSCFISLLDYLGWDYNLILSHYHFFLVFIGRDGRWHDGWIGRARQRPWVGERRGKRIGGDKTVQVSHLL